MANLNLTRFQGLDTLHTPAGLKDDFQTVFTNFDPTEQGYIVKRKGVSKRASIDDGNGLLLLGRYKTSSKDVVVTMNTISDDLDYVFVDSGGLSEITAAANGNIVHASQYADNFYFCAFAGDPAVWDGTTYTAMAGKPVGTQNLFHKDREWIINSVSGSLQDSLRYSEISGFGGTDFDASNHPASNVITIGRGDGQFCTKMIVFNDNLYIFKSSSTWILYTDSNTPSEWTLRQIEPNIGCTSKDAAVVHENLLYFASIDGIYRTDGTTFEEISSPLRDFFMNRELPNPSYGLIFRESLAVIGDQLFCFVYDDGAAAEDRDQCYIFNLKTKSWSKYEFNLWRPEASLRTPVVVPDISPTSMFLGSYPLVSGTDHGYLFLYGNPDFNIDSSDALRDFESKFRTKMFDFGEPGTWKRMTDATIDCWHVGLLGTWTWYYENNTTSVAHSLPEIVGNSSNARGLIPLPPAGWFRSVMGEYSDGAVGGKITIYGLTFNTTERKIAGKIISKGP